MTYEIHEKIEKWMHESDSLDFNAIFEQIVFHAERYCGYLPTIGGLEFLTRFRKWFLKSTNDEDQKTLFQLVPNIFYISESELTSLYRTVLMGPIFRWIIDELDLNISDQNIEEHLNKAIKETWFCPITDSMQISCFYHANNLESARLRPDWYSLTELGDPDKIINFMRQNNLKRLVLLEDFVASGSQMFRPVQLAAQVLCDYSILLAPLIICPKGYKNGERLDVLLPNLTFSPVLSLKENAFILEREYQGEEEIFKKTRDLINRLDNLVKGDNPRNYFTPFGYRKTGALIVTYSNCPDNTLPIIRHRSSSWDPLFPRSSRE